MKYWLMGISTMFFLTPIAYTFLRLAGKIGPADSGHAILLGAILAFVGICLGLDLGGIALGLEKKE